MKIILLGLFFTFLWSSASIATKIGLRSTTPLTFITIRFLIAGGLLMGYTYLLNKGQYRLPRLKEWWPLILLGLMNTTVYLGATTWAMTYTTAGLVNLFVTVNPFLVAFLSYFILERKILIREWIGMLCGAAGIFIAIYPELIHSNFGMVSIIVLGLGMFSMAMGSVYFKKVHLQMPNSILNAWQLIIGGFVLLPIAYLFERKSFFIDYNFELFGSLFWLIFVLSIGAMLLWFYLLSKDPVAANNWLFLTPVFGYILSALILKEPVTLFDLTGTLFVIVGLFISGNIKFSFFKPDKRCRRHRRMRSEVH